jgi:AhpD family alkylhydroperoxidase
MELLKMRGSLTDQYNNRGRGRSALSVSSETDMDKFEEMTARRKRAHARLVALKSPVYRAFLEMEQAAFADGALPKKQKELIAVGISVVKDCESCMQWHVKQAAAAGASFEEVLEAVEVGIEMGGGPATVSARFALEVMDSIGLKPGDRAGR